MRGTLVLGAASAPLLAACQLLFPTVAEKPMDAGADARDAGSDIGSDRRAEASPYNDPDSGNWQIYSLGLTSPYFIGGAFDGRHAYFSPQNGAVERHDTTAPFGSSWSSFDPSTVPGGSDLFSGAAFDGRFVYFVGFTLPSPVTHAIFARFDTQMGFSDRAAWSEFDVTAADPRAVSFAGAAFDGRFLYFAPIYNGFVERFDTTLPFQDGGSWVGYDLGPTGAPGFEGAIFDGRYVTFVPHYHSLVTDAGLGRGAASGLAVRLDTTATFGSAAAWSRFDTTTLDKNASGFAGGAFDGRYVYFVPFDNFVAIAVRYDTQKDAFDVASSWETFDCTRALSGAAGFVGGAFDGRYVYFVPNVNAASAPAGVLLRYDTTLAFGDPRSWSSYDIANQGSNAVGFAGAVFDGEYLYFVPFLGGIVAQFRARTTPLPPHLPTLPGSFL